MQKQLLHLGLEQIQDQEEWKSKVLPSNRLM